MIRVDVALDDAGRLVSCEVEGHAGAGPRGGDVVCAAVSVLTGTALKTLSRAEGVTVHGGAPERGSLWMETDCAAGGETYLSAVTAFLMEGLHSVSSEYPDYCSVRIRTERRKRHGS